MAMYDKLYQDIDNVNRVHINASDLSPIADANEENVTTRQLYFAVAVTSPGTVVIGDGNVTSCDNNDTTLTEERTSYGIGIQAKSRKLTSDRSYDMFLLTTVPSFYNPNESYNKASQGTFFNVLSVPPIPTSSPTVVTTPGMSSKTREPVFTKPAYESANLVAILVPVITVLIIALLGAGYWIHQRRNQRPVKFWNRNKKDRSKSSRQDAEEMSNEIHLYEEIPDPSMLNKNERSTESNEGYENVLLEDKNYIDLHESSKKSEIRDEENVTLDACRTEPTRRYENVLLDEGNYDNLDEASKTSGRKYENVIPDKENT